MVWMQTHSHARGAIERSEKKWSEKKQRKNNRLNAPGTDAKQRWENERSEKVNGKKMQGIPEEKLQVWENNWMHR